MYSKLLELGSELCTSSVELELKLGVGSAVSDMTGGERMYASDRWIDSTVAVYPISFGGSLVV